MATSGAGQPPRILLGRVDHDDRNQCDRQLVDTTIERFGRIDCLINKAGWHPPHRPIDDFSVDDFRSLPDLNLVSYFAACKFALPHLRKAKGNISAARMARRRSCSGAWGPSRKRDGSASISPPRARSRRASITSSSGGAELGYGRKTRKD